MPVSETPIIPSNFHKWRWWGVTAWIFLMTLVIGYAGLENRQRVQDIQNSRLSIAIEQCQEQNARNQQTKSVIDMQIKAIPAGPQREQAESQRASVFFIIDALAPYQDCHQLISERFGGING